jgi:hypothetical protein
LADVNQTNPIYSAATGSGISKIAITQISSSLNNMIITACHTGQLGVTPDRNSTLLDREIINNISFVAGACSGSADAQPGFILGTGGASDNWGLSVASFNPSPYVF